MIRNCDFPFLNQIIATINVIPKRLYNGFFSSIVKALKIVWKNCFGPQVSTSVAPFCCSFMSFFRLMENKNTAVLMNQSLRLRQWHIFPGLH